MLYGSVESSRFPYLKRHCNKGHLNLVRELLKGFSPNVFNKLYVTHSKSSNKGNLEPKCELIIFSFFIVALKATVVNSDS